jgi:Two component regulator propeller.
VARDRSGRGARYAGALTLLASLSLPVSAQLPFEVIGLGDGLPQSQLPTMAQDRDGFLWIGTLGGLARFDGNTIETFSTKDGLPSNYVEELLLDDEGRSGSEPSRASRAGATAGSRRSPAAGSARCRAIARDAEGRIWLGRRRGSSAARTIPASPSSAVRSAP